MNISGKVALITGSAKRIGRLTAIELAKRGARVAIHFRNSGQEANETLRLIQAEGGTGALFQADLSEIPAIEEMFRKLDQQFGGLDILVNSASTFHTSTAGETSAELWDEQLNSNARAPFFVAQSAAQMMMKRGEDHQGHQGKIINIVDVAGEVIWPGYFAYSVSKAALIAVNRGLAKAYAPSIQVNGIAPGPVLFPDHYTEEQKRSAIERTLLKRAGHPSDIVNAVVFLIENDYITGEIIHVDGGRHIM
jgi:NAD(P)-dependent dehydrogenase (short-subunit alcohol dehydrogenase family)